MIGDVTATAGPATSLVAWLTLFGLGAVHGLNPGMGWLFAVGLGVQRGERRAVWRALLPLAVGHGLAIAAAVSLATGLGLVLSPAAVRWGVVVMLLALGIRQLRRHWHPRAGGMRVNARQLVTWSFLVATAHGAGIMAAPFAMDIAAPSPAHAGHGGAASMALASAASLEAPAIAATIIHTLGYLLITAVTASIVYERAALHLLRRAWVNLDLIWAGTLVVTAVAIAI